MSSIGNWTLLEIILTVALIIETLFIILCLFFYLKKAKQQRVLSQKIVFSLAVTQTLRTLIAQKNQEAVLQISNALGELELVEEEINDKFYSKLNKKTDNNSSDTNVVNTIDNALCTCLENLQFEDATNQIREHIQILESAILSEFKEHSVSESIKKIITEKCRQIFAVDDEFEALNHLSEER